MKTTQILNIDQALAKLFAIDEKAPLSLPANVRMDLALLAGKLAPHLAAYERTRSGIARQVGLDPQGNVLPEKREEFFEKLQPALDADAKLKFAPLKAAPFSEEKAIPLQLLTQLMALEVLKD